MSEPESLLNGHREWGKRGNGTLSIFCLSKEKIALAPSLSLCLPSPREQRGDGDIQH